MTRISARLLCGASVLALLLPGLPRAAHAADRYWDANATSVGRGGTGDWTLALSLWSGNGDGVSGPYINWNNGALDDAFFGGTAGTVTLGSPVTAHDLTFEIAGFTLTGGTLTLGGTTPTITTTGTAIIDSVLAGNQGLIKDGNATLQLSGANTFSGNISLLHGTLYAVDDGALGAASNSITTGAGVTTILRIDGAPTARSVTIGDGGTLTLTGAGAGGALIGGNGNVNVAASNNPATIVRLTNDNSTYTGSTKFNGCNGVCSAYFTSIADLGQASSLGAPTDPTTGTITFKQSSQYSDSIIYLGDGDSSNRNWDLISTAGVIRNRGTGTLTLTGNIDMSSAGSFSAETGDFALLGILSGGSYNFTADAGRTITLGGANTFTGDTRIAGLVRAPVLADGGIVSSLGTGSAVTLNGGTLGYTGTGASSNRTWTANNANGIRNDGTGALALGGDFAFDPANPNPDSLTLGGSYTGTNTFSGVISGIGDLASEGAGTWVLSGANTFTGAITVNGGTLEAGNAAAFGEATGFTVNGGTLALGGFDLTAPSLSGSGGAVDLGANTLTVDATSPNSYAGSIAGTGGLTKTGAGTLTLTGANSYTGATTIGGGTLALDFSAAGAPASDIISGSSALILSGGALTVTGAAGGINSQTFSSTAITAGSTTVTAVDGAGGTTSLALGAITRTGGLVDFVLPATGAITTANPDGLLGGWATINGSDYAKVVGGGIVAFDATDYTNQDDASLWGAGEIVSDTDGAADSPFFGTVGADVQLGGLRYAAATDSTVAIDPAATLGIDGTIIVAPSVGAANQTLTGGTLTGAAGSTLGVQQNGDGIFTIESTIANNGVPATSFAKGGDGTLVLSGANTYTGGTTLSGGRLEVTTLADGGIASSIGASTNDPSNLVLESGTFAYTGSTNAASDRGLTLVNGGNDRAIEVANNTLSLTFGGKITSPDDAGFTKTGAGTLVLTSPDSDYVGVTTVAGPGSTLTVSTLSNGGAASSIGAATGDPANIVLDNDGRLQYTGGTIGIDRGFTLESVDGHIGVTSAGTTLTISGTAVGAGSFIKDGSGTLVLSGTNTYTGDTLVTAGTLKAGSTKAFGPGLRYMTVNSGATLDLGGFNISAGGLAGGGTVLLGGNTLTTAGGLAAFTGTITGTGGFTRGSGSYTQTISGCSNSYTGITTVQSSLAVDCIANGGDNSSIGASGADAANLVLDGGTFIYTGSNVTTDRGFTLARSSTLSVSNPTTTLEFGGPVVGAGGAFYKEGAGTLVLSGTNSYTGSTRVVNGILRAGSEEAFGASASMLLYNNAGATLDLAGFDTSVTYLEGGGTTGGNVALGGATLTITSGNNAASSYYEGAITGTGNLIKNGTANQRLRSCASDYSGTTTINAGILEVTCLPNGGTASSIGSSGPAAGNLILNGGTLRYAGAGGSTDRQFTLGPTVGNALDASGTGAIDFTSTAPLTFSGADTAQTLTLTGTNTDNNILAAQITNNGTGLTALTKTGDGTWILTNPGSDYTGITTISGGVLGVDKLGNGGDPSSIGASSSAAANIIIGNESTLRYTGAGDTTNRLFTLASGVTFLQSSGTGAIVFTDTGPLTYADTNQARTIALGGTNTGNNTLAGSIGDAGSGVTTLAKNDAGNWVLTGTNTYTGNTVINGGSLTLGDGGTTGSIASNVINAGTLIFNRSDEVTYGGLVSGAGVLEQNGAGKTILTGANTYLGETHVDAGTLVINGDQSAATGLLTVASGARLGGSGIIGGGVTVTGGTLAPGNSPGTLTINGDLNLDSASVLSMEFGQADVVGGPLNDLIEVGGNLTLDGRVDVTVSSGGSFDAGVYRIIGYDGTLTDNTLDLGTMPSPDVFLQTSVAHQVNLVNTTGLTLNFWDGDAGPKFDGAVDGGNGFWQGSTGNDDWTDIDGSINVPYADASFAIFSATPGTVTVDDLTAGAVTASGMQFMSDGYLISGDTLTLTGPEAEIRVGDGTAAGTDMTATIEAALTGASQLVKTDLGILVLSGVNTYMGGTAINGGTLSIADDANLGDVAGGLSLNGGTLETTADIASNRAVTLDGAGTLLADSGTALTLGGGITGAGALTKDGAGTLILTSDAAHAGGTTIAAGTLQVGDGGTVGSIAGDITDNGVLAFDRSDGLTVDGTVTGAGSLEKTGAGTIVLTAENAYTGGTTIGTGTLQLGDGGAGGSIAGDVVDNGALTFFRSDDFAFDGLVSGTGAVIKNGTGTTTLTADNSYKGSTTVNAGTLLINGDQTEATGLTAVASAATLGGNGIIGGDTVIDDGAILAPGTGTDVGTLTINGRLLLQGNGSTLNYDFGQSDVVGGPLNDLTVVGGDLKLDGTIDVTVSPGGSFDVGLYRVISYGGLLTDNTLDLGAMPPLSDVSVQTAVDKQVNLINTAGLTLNFWDGDAGPKGDGFVNGGGGWWQNAPGDDWTIVDGSINAAYGDGSFAIFSATPGTVTIDDTPAQISASGLQFASDGYEVTGDALTLVGPDATIRVGDGTAAGLDMTATISSVLTGDSGLTKTDLGTLILAGANTYTGTATVRNGTLLVNGDQSAATGTTHVEGAALGGTGIVGGDVAVAGGTLAPGSNGVGTLTIKGGLALDASSTLQMEFGEADVAGGTLNDLVEVGGDLVLDGTIDVTVPAGGSFDPGIYRIFDYGGTLTDNGLLLGTLPGGSTATVQTAVAGQVNLINTAGLALNFWDGTAGPKFDGTVNGGDGVWQNGNGNDNWADEGGTINATYQDAGFAVFSAAPGTVTVDDSLGSVQSSGMQFASDGYQIEGDAIELVGPQATIRVGDGTAAGADMTATLSVVLTGASQLVKTDLGTLVLSGANTYAGGTALNGGTLAISADANLGDAAGGLAFDGGTLHTTKDIESGRAVVFAGNGTVATDDGTTLTWNGALSGTGGLTKDGAGTLLLTGESDGYTGIAEVTEGTLAVTGKLGGAVTVASAGRLEGTGTIGALANAGAVAPGQGGFGTLTVAGDYAGNNGTLEIEAALAGDDSPSDRLVVGSTAGKTEVRVVNKGGFGAATKDGVKIVDVAGASNGTFTLKGDYTFEGAPAVVAGAYGYRLYKNGVTDPTDGDWYLRSSLLDPAAPQESQSNAPLYQPGVPLYESYAGILQSFNGLETLRQRVGNRSWEGGGDDNGVWAKMQAGYQRFAPKSSTSGSDYDVDHWQAQGGADAQVAESDKGRLVAGLSGRYGELSGDVASTYGSGKVATTGYGVGATLTWYGADGVYVDGQADATWYDSDLLSSATVGRLTKGNDAFGYAASVEAGKRVALDGNWSLVPQGQLIYSSVDFDHFSDPFGAAVSLDRSRSVKSRLGLSADFSNQWTEGSGQVSRIDTYGIANLYYDFGGSTRVDVSDTRLESENEALWGGLGYGFSYNWAGDRYSLYVEVSANTSLADFADSYSVKANGGLRLKW